MQQGADTLSGLFPALTTLRLELRLKSWACFQAIESESFAPSELWDLERKPLPHGNANLEVSLLLVGKLFTMRDDRLTYFMETSALNDIVYRATPSADPDAFCGLEFATVSAWTYDHDALMAEAGFAIED